MAAQHTFSRATREALQLLGTRVAVARRERRMTATELAQRAGVSPVTIRKVERGDPTVGLGVAFEVAALVGVPLFDESAERRSLDLDRAGDRLAVLPKRVRPREVDDAF
ncbi:MAG TPA: helix-turn-helix transcriptional regulator [Gaiellales bacterium]|jgi:DNA-binding XRE family transcriptional regulator